MTLPGGFSFAGRSPLPEDGPPRPERLSYHASSRTLSTSTATSLGVLFIER